MSQSSQDQELRPLHLALVLVEPAGPLNVGSVARLCANFSSPQLVIELRLVAPRCNPLAEEAQRMAVHGGGVLAEARHFSTLAEALADCSQVVATSGRGEGEPREPLALEPALAWLLAPAIAGLQAPPPIHRPPIYPPPLALVFGREDRGLAADELLQAGQLLRLTTGPGYRSLNLSHAVAVVLHELHHLIEASAGEAPSPSLELALAPRGAIEALFSDAEALLMQVGFLYPHTAAARMAKLRGLLQRSGLSAEEAALLRGMVRQCRWAVDNTP